MDKDQLVLELRLAEIERTLVMLATEIGSIDVLADMLELRRHAEVDKGVPARAFTLLKLVQKSPRPAGPSSWGELPAETAPPAAPPDGQPAAAAPVVAAARYVLLEVAQAATGYSVEAMRRKIDEGSWVEGAEWVTAPDGRTLIDLRGYEKWAARERD